MTLSQSTLKSQIEAALNSLTGDSAPSAERTQAEAFGEYFKEATFAGAPVSGSAVDGAVSAMAAAMTFTGVTEPSVGAAVLAAGYAAFWATLVATPANFWASATVITPPPGLAGLADALEAMFPANNQEGVTVSDAAQAMAIILHASAGLGGIAQPPSPTGVPIL